MSFLKAEFSPAGSSRWSQIPSVRRIHWCLEDGGTHVEEEEQVQGAVSTPQPWQPARKQGP